MPSSTPKQARTMAAAAHNPEFAAKMGIPTRVAKEFNQADAGTGILSHNHDHAVHHHNTRSVVNRRIPHG